MAGEPKPDRRTIRSRESYLAALERLRKRLPQHPKLRAAVTSGKGYSITPTTVALEAGKSRDPLYKRYPDILVEIQRGPKSPAEARDTKASSSMRGDLDRLERLRQEVSNLKSANAKLATQNLALLVRLANAEDGIERLKRDKSRLLKRNQQIIEITDVVDDNKE